MPENPENHEGSRVLFEGYPAAIAIDDGIPDRLALYLVDLPGCGVQAPDLEIAIEKMRALVPRFLEELQEQGVALPAPSSEPTAAIAGIRWTISPPTVSGTLTNERVAHDFDPVAVPAS